MDNNLMVVVDERVVLGKEFRIYGTFENPLFLAKDVAEWIDYCKSGAGSYDVTNMLKVIDEEEKVKHILTTNSNRGYNEAWFLTEDGLYEVLMQSRKPLAKEFKKEVKKILKSVRQNGMYATDSLLDDPDLLLKTVTKLTEERRARLLAEQEAERAKQAELYAKTKQDEEMRRARTAMQNSGVKTRKINKLEKEIEVLESELKGLTIMDSREAFNEILRKISKITCIEINEIYKEAYRLIIHQGVPVYTRRKEAGYTKKGRYKVSSIDCIYGDNEWGIAMKIVASMARKYCVNISSFYTED